MGTIGDAVAIWIQGVEVAHESAVAESPVPFFSPMLVLGVSMTGAGQSPPSAPIGPTTGPRAAFRPESRSAGETRNPNSDCNGELRCDAGICRRPLPRPASTPRRCLDVLKG